MKRHALITMAKAFPLLLPVVLVVAGCQKKEPTWGGDDPNSFVSKPKEINDVLVQEGKGWS